MQNQNEFAQEFTRRTNGSQDIAYGGLLYDVTWVLATALNNTMTMIANNVSINGTDCEDVPGSLVPLEEFTYANEKMGCLIQWNIKRTSFLGVSVSPNIYAVSVPGFFLSRFLCLATCLSCLSIRHLCGAYIVQKVSDYSYQVLETLTEYDCHHSL